MYTTVELFKTRLISSMPSSNFQTELFTVIDYAAQACRLKNTDEIKLFFLNLFQQELSAKWQEIKTKYQLNDQEANLYWTPIINYLTNLTTNLNYVPPVSVLPILPQLTAVSTPKKPEPIQPRRPQSATPLSLGNVSPVEIERARSVSPPPSISTNFSLSPVSQIRYSLIPQPKNLAIVSGSNLDISWASSEDEAVAAAESSGVFTPQRPPLRASANSTPQRSTLTVSTASLQATPSRLRTVNLIPGSPLHEKATKNLNRHANEQDVHPAITKLFVGEKAIFPLNFLATLNLRTLNPAMLDWSGLDESMLRFANYYKIAGDTNKKFINLKNIRHFYIIMSIFLFDRYREISQAMISSRDIGAYVITNMLYNFRTNPCLLTYELIREFLVQRDIVILNIKPIEQESYLTIFPFCEKLGFMLHFCVDVTKLLDPENNVIEHAEALKIVIIFKISPPNIYAKYRTEAEQKVAQDPNIQVMLAKCDLETKTHNTHLTQAVAEFKKLTEFSAAEVLVVQKKCADPNYKIRHCITGPELIKLNADAITPEYTKTLLDFAMQHDLNKYPEQKKEYDAMLALDLNRAVNFAPLGCKKDSYKDLSDFEASCRTVQLDEIEIKQLALLIPQAALNPCYWAWNRLVAFLTKKEVLNFGNEMKADDPRPKVNKKIHGGHYWYMKHCYSTVAVFRQTFSFGFPVFSFRGVVNLKPEQYDRWYGPYYLLVEQSLIETLKDHIDQDTGLEFYEKLLGAQGLVHQCKPLAVEKPYLFASLYQQQ